MKLISQEIGQKGILCNNVGLKRNINIEIIKYGRHLDLMLELCQFENGCPYTSILLPAATQSCLTLCDYGAAAHQALSLEAESEVAFPLLNSCMRC